PHVETRFIASKRLTRSQDAINRRLYREFTRQLFVHRLLFPTCVYTVALVTGGLGRGVPHVLGAVIFWRVETLHCNVSTRVC
ncbi:MAG: hypothetical protein RMX65_012770, partial [Nostoc sp. DedQUE01]|nr:hypothetical protein [Nostoc sp. DedQUE01]